MDFLFLPLYEVHLGVSHGEAVFHRERIGKLGDAEPWDLSNFSHEST